jgi:hypothetical protein
MNVNNKRNLLAVPSFSHVPVDHWRNDYPIVCVHGFCGWVPDETQTFGDYFRYTSRPEIAESNMIFQADLSPIASLHDRACELY